MSSFLPLLVIEEPFTKIGHEPEINVKSHIHAIYQRVMSFVLREGKEGRGWRAAGRRKQEQADERGMVADVRGSAAARSE
jgi:hypothetical protein